jgi:hypothetical protein
MKIGVEMVLIESGQPEKGFRNGSVFWRATNYTNDDEFLENGAILVLC